MSMLPVPCPYCGADAWCPCVTVLGAIAGEPHAGRRRLYATTRTTETQP